MARRGARLLVAASVRDSQLASAAKEAAGGKIEATLASLICAGDANGVRERLQQNEEGLDQVTDEDGSVHRTLLFACRAGHEAVVQVLIARGAFK